ncbi:hypothetical protein HH299_10645 [Xanthomonas sp. Kuri4-2]
MQLLPAMAVFALVASISPGPVNLLALACCPRPKHAMGEADLIGARSSCARSCWPSLPYSDR